MTDINAEFIGAEEAVRRTDEFVRAQEMSIEGALKYILQQMREHAIRAGTYADRTGATRASISINVETMKRLASPNEAFSLAAQNAIPKIKIEDDTYLAVISVGMFYAVFLETKTGFTVLQGTVNAFEYIIPRLLSQRLNAQNVETKMREVH